MPKVELANRPCPFPVTRNEQGHTDGLPCPPDTWSMLLGLLLVDQSEENFELWTFFMEKDIS